MPFPGRKEAQEFIRSVMDSDLSCRYFMESLVETAEGCQMMFSAQAMAANIAYEEDWFHLLPRIPCPVLLLRAKGSGAVCDADSARMQALIPHCTAREIPIPTTMFIRETRKSFMLILTNG